MKVLITSGGTKIPIDKVRSITNMSNGTLGSKLAAQALKEGNSVIFLRAEKSKSPMQMTIDFDNTHPDECREKFEEQAAFHKNFSHLFYDYKYVTFEDYQKKLEALISLHKPDIIILAAAVSDYAPETVVDGKIRTGSDLNIALKPLPKVIASVRNWAGQRTFVVGFKLLVGVDEDELINAAKDSIRKNNLDLVCANDLNTLLCGNHQILVVDRLGRATRKMAGEVWDYILKKSCEA